jgi:hypothetical protein
MHMRIILAAVTLLAAGATFDSAKAADPYRWCAEYGGDRGGRNCWFMTLEQCRWAISGTNTASCQPNPFYTGPRDELAPRPRRRG